MTVSKEEQERRVSRLREGLERAGLKTTHQRLEICREVAASAEHPDAAAVHQGVRGRVPTVSLDTVYRTLRLLLDLGLVGALRIPGDNLRFDPEAAPHHHFICRICGRARDFHHAAFDRLAAPDEVRGWGRIERVQVEIKGVCGRCRTQGRVRAKLKLEGGRP